MPEKPQNASEAFIGVSSGPLTHGMAYGPQAGAVQEVLSRLKKLLNLTVKIFSDKKMFTVNKEYNCCNHCIIVHQGESATPHKPKHPTGVMVVRIISSDCKMCLPIFILTGLKVNTNVYIGLLEQHLVPWLRRNYPEGNCVFQHDGVPAHTSKSTQEWMATNLSDFWAKDIGPPSSPDLNPLDFSI
jgi:hypothetical protein